MLLTATSAQTVLGQPVTFTAKVNVVAPGVGLPSGTVTFFNGTVSLGPATLDNTGQASLTTSSLTLGPHAITAKYGGDGSFNGSTSPVLTETITKVLPPPRSSPPSIPRSTVNRCCSRLRSALCRR